MKNNKVRTKYLWKNTLSVIMAIKSLSQHYFFLTYLLITNDSYTYEKPILAVVHMPKILRLIMSK